MNNSNDPHLLIIGLVWPEPDSSAAGRRMMQLIELFSAAGWAVTFASASSKSRHVTDLSVYGVAQVPVEINSATFDDFVADLQPSAVMFDRFITEEQFGWRVAGQCAQTLQILDTEDLHFLRRARRKAVENDRSFKKEDLLKSSTAKREIASILRCDLSLIISEYEMKLLQQFFTIDKSLLHYQPFRVDGIDDANQKKGPTFEQRTHFVMIGNFRHAPNRDAVQYLYHTVWPLIRKKLPEAEVHIYGAYPSKKIKKLHQTREGFLIKGRVENAAAVVRQARVCLAPLRFGAGLKGKLLEAMECGTPSVTTCVGAEGLAGKMDWCGYIADEPHVFAREAVSLYLNKKNWQAAQRQGVRIVNRRFAAGNGESPLLAKIDRIKNQLKPHRRQNFMGAMLRHHTLAATKYMSRWIELKNKYES